MKNFLLSAAIAATLISSAAFADSGSKLSAFDGVPSESVSRVELDAVSGEGLWTTFKNLVLPKKPVPKKQKVSYPLSCGYNKKLNVGFCG
jgi:hypothetical protein